MPREMEVIRKPYLKVTKICDIIKIFDILLLAEISQDINIAVCPFISRENVMIRYDDNLLAIPDLNIPTQ